MAHYVQCIYCQERFDRDKLPFTQISERRYAHEECANRYASQISQEEKDYEELEKYIMKLFSKDYLTARIRKQIRDYRQDYGYTFSGMLKCLKWWYEIKQNTTEKANDGVGIIPFVYDQARDYYYAIWLANEVNKDKNIENYKPRQEVIEIGSPQVYVTPPKLFRMEGEDE